MPITLRYIKQAPLTSDELDHNFEDLDKRIKYFEERSEALEGVQSIKNQGETLVVLGTKGSVLGEVSFPGLKVSFQGIWKSSTPYQCNDLVSHEHKIFLCTKSHVQDHFASDFWECILDVSNFGTTLPLIEEGHLPPPDKGKMILLERGDAFCPLLGDGREWQQILTKPL